MRKPDLSIFISYRHDDVGANAALLEQHLRARGVGTVWRDVSGLRPGVPWRKAIDDVIENADVVLLLIGRRWLESSEGGPRLGQPNDVHRHEVEAALAAKALLIPILIDGVSMPRADELPASIAGLPEIQGYALSDRDFGVEVRALLDQIMGELSSTKGSQTEVLKRSRPLTGKDIYERLVEKRDPPKVMGRSGGLRGRLLDQDIATGNWATHQYQVSYSTVRQPPKNWFRPHEFQLRIDSSRGRQEDRTSPKPAVDSPIAPVPAPSDEDLRSGRDVAERLRALDERGALITAAERGEIAELECATEECLCPGGRGYFDQKTHPPTNWAPSLDHFPVLEKDGGHRVLGNVRLAHVLCNRVDYAKLAGKPHDKDRATAAAEAVDWKKNHQAKPGGA